jgi:phospholipid/cholesterol/gamma-HCH transport system substrate-binding protein
VRFLRNTDEWIGLLVLGSIALFLAAALHAGLLSDWFRSTQKLRIMLPETGSQGLSPGADIQVLGTRVGTVRRVVVDPSQRMYAEAELDEQATAFIRRDSKALVKKQFGVAGAAFLDIARGTGAPLDWSYAVIDAETERDPTESVGAIIDQVKVKIFPILDDAARMMRAFADTADGISQGHGNIGRLVKEEDLANQLTQTLGNLKTATEQLNATLADVRGLATTAAGPDGVPALLRRADASLASVQKATQDLARATPQLPAITRDVSTSTANLPALLTQAQQTASQLEKVLDQLRHTWPLSGSAAPEPTRLSPAQVRP